MKTEWNGKLFVGILGQAPRQPKPRRPSHMGRILENQNMLSVTATEARITLSKVTSHCCVVNQ